jgi:hypothetical protein
MMVVLSHAYVSINKGLAISLTVLSNTITTLIAGFISRFGAAVRFTFLANAKDRMVELYKKRSVLANTSNTKVQK